MRKDGRESWLAHPRTWIVVGNVVLWGGLILYFLFK